ncbi:Membrane transport protein [Oscillospiraceae bacterium]|nr:Membrane transport protein [Oscillospiraceae bacterium]
MSTAVILQQMAVICILVSIGFYLCKKGVMDNIASKKISAIVMDICNPALILASILSGNITADRHDLLISIVLSMGFYIFLVGLGFVIPRILGVAPDKRRFYNLMTVYTNVGFIGIPVARAILPENAILNVIVCNVMYSLLFYTHGVTILSGGKEKMNIKKVFSPGTIMAVLALVVFWFDISLPPVLANSISYVGNATVFLSMTLLGAAIARSNFMAGLKDLKIWIYIGVRMVTVPFAMFFLLRALHVDSITILALCLMACMPVGNLPLIQAEKTGEDTSILSSAIAVSTVVSILTITLAMSFFSALIG